MKPRPLEKGPFEPRSALRVEWNMSRRIFLCWTAGLLPVMNGGCSRLDEQTIASFRRAVESADADGAAQLLETHPKLAAAKLEGGETFLHLAAAKGQAAIVRLLLDKGADVHVADGRGSSAIVPAAGSGSVETVALLLDRGADPGMNASGEMSAIHKAAATGRVEVLRLLHERGVDVNLRLKSGTTPLHAAAMLGNRDAVVYLLENGADVNAQRDDGATPMDWAYGNGHPEIRDLLRERAEKE